MNQFDYLKAIAEKGRRRGELVVAVAGGRYGKSVIREILIEVDRRLQTEKNRQIDFVVIDEVIQETLRGEDGRVLAICPTEALSFDQASLPVAEPFKPQIHHGPVIKRGKGKVKKW